MTRFFAALLLFITLSSAPIYAQSNDENREDSREDNGVIVTMIEDTLSTKSRQIRLYDIDGLLASDARVGRITIADRKGVWLTINDAEIQWSRLALFRGRLEIERLTASQIEISRAPLPDRALPIPEATPFRLPELPVSIEIGELTVAELILGAPIIGERAELSLTGAISLIDAALDTRLALTRLDGPGGEFRLDVAVDQNNQDVSIDLSFHEPKNGILATVLASPDQARFRRPAHG